MLPTLPFCALRAEQLYVCQSRVWDGSPHGYSGAKCARPNTLVSISRDGSQKDQECCVWLGKKTFLTVSAGMKFA